MTEKTEKSMCAVCGYEFSLSDGIDVSCEEQKYLACPRCGSTKRSRIFDHGGKGIT